MMKSAKCSTGILLLAFPMLLGLVGCGNRVKPIHEITIAVGDTAQRRVVIAPLGVDVEPQAMELVGDSYSATIATSPTGFYEIVSVKGYSQSIIPHYVSPTKSGATSRLTFGERGAISLEGSADNEALAAYVNAYANVSRSLWDGTVDVASPEALKRYMTRADSVADAYRCSAPVKEYLRIWGYVNAFNDYASVQRILKVKTEDMPYTRADLLPQPHTMFDSPIAALFSSTPTIIYSGIPNKKDLDSAFIYVEQHYTDTTLVKKVNDYIASRYVSRYDYSNDFDKGLECLQAATERYGLDPRHAEDFAKRRATVPGQPFPDGIVLQDRDGNVVDFSSFRGKYVYIDMWASWCVPCLREVPVLQNLEKSLKNKKVEFVSISIDANQEAWKKKMDEKNMHGHQLWNPGGTLGKALNVKGIPFFVIYDPDGKLYMHGAPRPSQGKGLVELLEGLK